LEDELAAFCDEAEQEEADRIIGEMDPMMDAGTKKIQPKQVEVDHLGVDEAEQRELEKLMMA